VQRIVQAFQALLGRRSGVADNASFTEYSPAD
jgi:hypothetical protein